MTASFAKTFGTNPCRYVCISDIDTRGKTPNKSVKTLLEKFVVMRVRKSVSAADGPLPVKCDKYVRPSSIYAYYISISQITSNGAAMKWLKEENIALYWALKCIAFPGIICTKNGLRVFMCDDEDYFVSLEDIERKWKDSVKITKKMTVVECVGTVKNRFVALSSIVKFSKKSEMEVVSEIMVAAVNAVREAVNEEVKVYNLEDAADCKDAENNTHISMASQNKTRKPTTKKTVSKKAVVAEKKVVEEKKAVVAEKKVAAEEKQAVVEEKKKVVESLPEVPGSITMFGYPLNSLSPGNLEARRLIGTMIYPLTKDDAFRKNFNESMAAVDTSLVRHNDILEFVKTPESAKEFDVAYKKPTAYSEHMQRFHEAMHANTGDKSNVEKLIQNDNTRSKCIFQIPAKGINCRSLDDLKVVLQAMVCEKIAKPKETYKSFAYYTLNKVYFIPKFQAHSFLKYPIEDSPNNKEYTEWFAASASRDIIFFNVFNEFSRSKIAVLEREHAEVAKDVVAEIVESLKKLSPEEFDAEVVRCKALLAKY